MTQHVALDPGDRAIWPFFDDLQEHLGASGPSFALVVLGTGTDPTAIRALAGSDNDQATVAINGRYRRRTTNVDASHPGGAAGTYDVYVTASDNVFTTGTPTVDTTDYSFSLTIRASGSPPTGVALYRKVGEVDWDGTRITRLRQLMGSRRDGGPVHAISPHSAFPALTVRGAPGQTQPLALFTNNAGTPKLTIAADGALDTTGALSCSSVDGLTLSGNGGKDLLALTNTGANTGLTIGGDVTLYREAADILATDDKLHVAGELELDGALNHDGSQVGFFGVSPVSRPNATAEIKAALVSLGLLTGGGATNLDLNGGAISAALGLSDGSDLSIGTSTGSKIGQSGSKIGFFGVTPVARPGATAEIKGALAGLGLLTDGGAANLLLDGGELSGASAVTTAELVVTDDATIGGLLAVGGGFSIFGQPLVTSRRDWSTQPHSTFRNIDQNMNLGGLANALCTLVDDLIEFGFFT